MLGLIVSFSRSTSGKMRHRGPSNARLCIGMECLIEVNPEHPATRAAF